MASPPRSTAMLSTLRSQCSTPQSWMSATQRSRSRAASTARTSGGCCVMPLCRASALSASWSVPKMESGETRAAMKGSAASSWKKSQSRSGSSNASPASRPRCRARFAIRRWLRNSHVRVVAPPVSNLTATSVVELLALASIATVLVLVALLVALVALVVLAPTASCFGVRSRPRWTTPKVPRPSCSWTSTSSAPRSPCTSMITPMRFGCSLFCQDTSVTSPVS
mmetsp:Transcript_2386/g.7092  ORF Transcript_2386/g.7092 Transcript_2386/m.7092 type:complete len:224 (+) Transcript_2386:152-823(+)